MIAALAIYLQAAAAAERREDLERRAQAVLADAESVRGELATQRAAIQALRHADAPPLRAASGEPIEPAIGAWFDAHTKVAGRLEALIELAERAPTEEARRRIDPDAARSEHAGIATEAARMATELGRFSLASMWIDRATRTGSMSSEEGATQTANVETTRTRRIEEDLEKARGILAATRDRTATTPELVEQQVLALVRLAGPDLVRLLLTPRYLDSDNELERRVVIAALGRIGDRRTVGPQGVDAVQALAARLSAIDVRRDLPTALAVAEALGDLRDARAHAAFEAKRLAAGSTSPFAERSYNAFTRVPLPEVPTAPGDENVATLTKRAEALADKSRWQEAVTAYDRILALSPDAVTAYRWRARAKAMAGDKDGALRDYAEALRRWPDWPDALAGRALVLIELQRNEEALRDAERALAKDAGLWEAHLAIGTIEFSLGRYAKAEAAFTRAIEIDANLPIPWMQRGMARQALGREADAQADFRQLKELNPDAPEVLLLSAQNYLDTKQYELALADADRAITLDPSRAELYGIRALCWALLGHDPGKVAADIERMIELAPGITGLRVVAGQAWLAIKRFPEAMREFDLVIEKIPDNATALVMRGEVFEFGPAPDLDKARRDYSAAIAPIPASSPPGCIGRSCSRASERATLRCETSKKRSGSPRAASRCAWRGGTSSGIASSGRKRERSFQPYWTATPSIEPPGGVGAQCAGNSATTPAVSRT